MSERNKKTKRDWGSASYSASLERAAEVEQLMRHILALFSSGCLVYRSRDHVADQVSTKSDRLKRLRTQLDGSPAMAS